MKKFIIFFFVLLFILLIVSCDDNSNDVSKEKSNELLSYLENNNAEGIKSMFCEIIRSTGQLDEQIEVALEFFEGEIISYDDLIRTTNRSQSRERGIITLLSIRPYIKNVETTTDKVYEIWFNADIINVDNESRVGISELRIKDANNNECVIGDFYLVYPERKRYAY